MIQAMQECEIAPALAQRLAESFFGTGHGGLDAQQERLDARGLRFRRRPSFSLLLV